MTGVPLVSIVLPTYDRLPLLREAVASVRAQTFADWELVVVDDGSTDGTRAYLEALATDDTRVRPLALPHSGTATIARSAGVSASRGDWIAFLDSDDLWLPRKLEVQLRETLQHPECGWSYTAYRHVDARGNEIPGRPARATPPRSGWILEGIVRFTIAAAIPTLLVRRSLFDAIGGFDQALMLRSDYDLALRLALASESVGVTDTLVIVRDHPARTTSSYPQLGQLEENEVVFRKAMATAPTAHIRRLCAAQCAVQHAAMARVHADARDRRAAWRALEHGVRVAPTSRIAWRAVVGQAARQVGLRR